MREPIRHFHTAEVAKAVGVHPNTVRLYETWGFLSPVPRAPNGYRLYTQEHIDQMRMVRLALHGVWPGRKIKQSALQVVQLAARSDLGGALEQAYKHVALVQAERAQAEAAASFLERWAHGAAADATGDVLSIHQAAKLLGVTVDMLRNWERNGLLNVPRNPRNNYRRYGADEIGRLRVIRLLLRAGYSMMAVLRMLIEFDRGQREGLRETLDTPRSDEEMPLAFDRWLSTLTAQEERARQMIRMLEERIQKQQ